MKKIWTERTAIQALKTSDVTFIGDKTMVLGAKGLSGLNACSAFDYLRNHCGYC